jgi:hypothetical protein
MKKIVFLVFATLAAMLSVSCSRSSSFNPVVVNLTEPGDGTSTVNMIINVPANPVLAKSMAGSVPDYSPSVIIIRNNGVTIDSSEIIAGQTTINKSFSVTRKTGYVFSVSFWSKDGGIPVDPTDPVVRLLSSGQVAGTVPDSASFTVAINCISQAEIIKLLISLKNTPAFGIADSAKLTWTQINTAYYPIKGQSKVVILPTDTTVAHYGLICLANTPSVTSFNVKEEIYLSDGSKYSGNGNIDLSPSVNSTITINLYKIGGPGSGSLAKLVITSDATGQLTAYVVFN